MGSRATTRAAPLNLRFYVRFWSALRRSGAPRGTHLAILRSSGVFQGVLERSGGFQRHNWGCPVEFEVLREVLECIEAFWSTTWDS